MALRNILVDDDPVLRKKSRPVDRIDMRVRMLLDDMMETLHHEDGVGLAAPQVGVLKRIVVIDTGEVLLEMINPEIIETEGEEMDNEGCLSLPGRVGVVPRPVRVRARYTDREGRKTEIEGEGLLARAICHEFDHLNGVLFIDRAVEMLEPDEPEED
ncbi:MAG: peptide deformylase [Bacillota bacterium]